MDIVLIGAGGHAKAVVEILTGRGDRIVAYVDPTASDWLAAKHLKDADTFENRDAQIVMGLGGMTSERLRHRLALLGMWMDRGFAAPIIVHPSAVISASARIESGTIILAQAVVQPGAVVGRGVIVNTGAIVEHDAEVGEGCHVAPRATLLGGAVTGATAMIGSGVVILPDARVPANTLVPALTLYRAADTTEKPVRTT